MKKKPGTQRKKLKKFDDDRQLKILIETDKGRGLSNLCCSQPTCNHKEVMSQCAEVPLK